jgi:DNA adenine methylase
MTRIAAPHPIPYQGSKRRLAADILALYPHHVGALYEPFAGSAAVTLAAATATRADRYVLADVLQPLAELWKLIINSPSEVAAAYRQLWQQQGPQSAGHFNRVREKFNKTGDPAALLYLTARCVKNAIRFNPDGGFNQSVDRRRKGMHPDAMTRNIMGASALLAGRTEVLAASYEEVLKAASASDLVYLDPPYQGVSSGRDRRYFRQLRADDLFAELDLLNRRQVPFLLSYDGTCGARAYGVEPPRELGLARVWMVTGRSSQSTLLGRNEVTRESVYVSPAARSIGVRLPDEVFLPRGKPLQETLGL